MVDVRKSSASAFSQRGFTLIEIVISVMILAVSLITLMGLQSAVVKRSLDDQNRLSAMLFARQILADIESAVDPIEIQERQGAVIDFLEQHEADKDDSELTRAQAMDALLRVEFWPIPQNAEALKRITLQISWGDTTDQSFTIYHFVPNDEQFEEEELEDEEEDV